MRSVMVKCRYGRLPPFSRLIGWKEEAPHLVVRRLQDTMWIYAYIRYSGHRHGSGVSGIDAALDSSSCRRRERPYGGTCLNYGCIPSKVIVPWRMRFGF